MAEMRYIRATLPWDRGKDLLTGHCPSGLGSVYYAGEERVCGREWSKRWIGRDVNEHEMSQARESNRTLRALGRSFPSGTPPPKKGSPGAKNSTHNSYCGSVRFILWSAHLVNLLYCSREDNLSSRPFLPKTVQQSNVGSFIRL